MTTHGSVTRLVADLRSDDSSVRNRAAQLIWEHYFGRLLELSGSAECFAHVPDFNQ
jgi:hypothetical protein